jgi:glycosyltransferase involved in cell wall biosynthesis
MIKLSVLMITYNHERYIAQALDSILMQQVNFDFEVVIGEDRSTDTTREIVSRYKNLYPNKIRLLLHDSNIGMLNNLAQTYAACKGEYIALLEGDDYWTSKNKLQFQVDFLDAHSECSICFHPVSVLSEETTNSTSFPDFPAHHSKKINTIEDLLSENFIPNCSTVFRNNLITIFPPWFFQLRQGDWSLHILNAEHGTIGYLDSNMAVYRMHPGGVWTKEKWTSRLEAIISSYEAFLKHLAPRYQNRIKSRIADCALELAVAYYDSKNIKKAKESLLKCVRNRTFHPDKFYEYTKLLIKFYLPPLYRLAQAARGRR